MKIGLSKEELVELGYFGKTAEESDDTLFGKSGIGIKALGTMIKAIRDKNIELILANNERIAQQLKDAGVKLSD
jgi:hypothetical protein